MIEQKKTRKYIMLINIILFGITLFFTGSMKAMAYLCNTNDKESFCNFEYIRAADVNFRGRNDILGEILAGTLYGGGGKDYGILEITKSAFYSYSCKVKSGSEKYITITSSDGSCTLETNDVDASNGVNATVIVETFQGEKSLGQEELTVMIKPNVINVTLNKGLASTTYASCDGKCIDIYDYGKDSNTNSLYALGLRQKNDSQIKKECQQSSISSIIACELSTGHINIRPKGFGTVTLNVVSNYGINFKANIRVIDPNTAPDSCTITFNSNDGSIATQSRQCTCSTCEIDIGSVSKPVRVDFSFNGWGFDPNCTIGVLGGEQTFTGNTTMYACWKSSSSTTKTTTTKPTTKATTTKPTTKAPTITAPVANNNGFTDAQGVCRQIAYKNSKGEIAYSSFSEFYNPEYLLETYVWITGCQAPLTTENCGLASGQCEAKCNVSRVIKNGYEYDYTLQIYRNTLIGADEEKCKGIVLSNTTQTTTPTTTTPGQTTTPQSTTPGQTTTPRSSGYTCDPVTPIKGATASMDVRVCYTVTSGKEVLKGSDVKEVYKCAEGYRTEYRPTSDDMCSDLTYSSSPQDCYKIYQFTCVPTRKPSVSGSGSLVRPNDNLGTLSFVGKPNDAGIPLNGYFISQGTKPVVTSSEGWVQFKDTSYTEYLQKEAGTYFVWVRDTNGILSYSLMAKVHSDLINTTLNNVQITNPDGSVSYTIKPTDSSGTGYLDGVTSSTYALLSNNFKNSSPIAEGFDLFTTSYELTVSENKIAVYATLTDKDASYVEGFEPRTVDLEYGRNVILIKIQNNKGNVRTYTFVVTRPDDRESINTLSSLTVSKGKINFDPYISDYTISVPKNTKSVNINGTLMSGKAYFIEGYEPRKVTLNNDITSAVIKTMSEAGVIRNYVLTFIKTGADEEDITKDSVYLSSLTMPGTEFTFNKEITNYTISVEYEINSIPVFGLPESENAKVELLGNTNLEVGTNLIQITLTNGSKSKVYNIYVIRKEADLAVSGNTKLSTLTVKDYNINFNPDILDYELKIKREKTLLLSATPQSNRSEIYMYGNNDLTTFSTIRVKVIAENGDTGIYSLDIKKDPYNKALEITAAIIGCIIIASGVIILVVKRKRQKHRNYVEE